MRVVLLGVLVLLSGCHVIRPSGCPAPPPLLMEEARVVPLAEEGKSLSQQAALSLSIKRAHLYWLEVEKRKAIIKWGEEFCEWKKGE